VAVYNSLDSSLSVFQSHDDERGMLGYQVWCEKLLYVGRLFVQLRPGPMQLRC
jgi:hypothetical protein